MKKILFLDTENGYKYSDPIASLVELPVSITKEVLSALERTNIAVGDFGGDWKKMMEEGRVEYKLLSSGVKSDYKESDYDEVYQLITGMY